MRSSIQDYCKKINRQLTLVPIISLLVSALCFGLITVYVHSVALEKRQAVVYLEGNKDEQDKNRPPVELTHPFGSKKGTTYTFSWCAGSSRISQKNKIFFASEEEAKGFGRRLSKLCNK